MDKLEETSYSADLTEIGITYKSNARIAKNYLGNVPAIADKGLTDTIPN